MFVCLHVCVFLFPSTASYIVRSVKQERSLNIITALLLLQIL